VLFRSVGFRGVLFSDDLEMAAVALTYPVEASAVAAVRAGCDVLLVCSNEEWQDRALAALVSEAKKDEAFRARCVEACERSLEARCRFPPKPVRDTQALDELLGDQAGRALLAEIAERAKPLEALR